MSRASLRQILLLPLAVAATACATMPQEEQPWSGADVTDAAGRELARSEIGQDGTRLKVTIDARGMAPGTYAWHIHATGRCDAPDFASAGGHWNPTGRSHGTGNPQGPHLGDLPNLTIGANGSGYAEARIEGASLIGGASPLMDADGAAIVIHAQADDNRTDPSGNSGARIACGVLRMAG